MVSRWWMRNLGKRAMTAKIILAIIAVAAPLSATAFTIPPAGTPANQGYKLFMLNCAHCHGSDATGDEGPDLHGITKSDAKITKIIQGGVKGQMPKFSAKLTLEDTKSLIAFIRTLED